MLREEYTEKMKKTQKQGGPGVEPTGPSKSERFEGFWREHETKKTTQKHDEKKTIGEPEGGRDSLQIGQTCGILEGEQKKTHRNTTAAEQ